MRVLLISLSTYSAPYNDGTLEQLAPCVEDLTAVAGDVATLWGGDNRARSGSGFKVVVLPLRFARTYATSQLVGIDEVAVAARPTIIHVACEPWQGVAVQSVRLARRLGVPIGIQFAENGPLLRGVGGAIRRVVASWVLKRCDYAVGWSTESTRIAERLAPGIRTDTFPGTGVPLGTELAGPTEQWFGTDSSTLPKLAFVGRFSAEKGIDDFLDVCDQLARRVPLRAALAGGDEAHERVRAWVAERPWAFLHGILPRPSVSLLLSAADVLVCPSRTTNVVKEQFGKAAVEAMAVATPVFAYDCGALSEVVGAGGVVVPEGAQDQLVDALARHFCSSAVDRVGLARDARLQAARFTDDVIAARLLSLWSSNEGAAPRA